MYEESRVRAWAQAQSVAEGRGIRILHVAVPSAGHCAYSSLQASLHGTWDAQGDVELRRAINTHGRGMDPSTRIDEVGGQAMALKL